MMRRFPVRHAIALALGIVGMASTLLVWHAYNDHRLIHAMSAYLSTRPAVK